jgi:nicotinamide-nucleotide amidase
MRAEVIGIGTEILLGQIANTNAREISERLARSGVDVLHHQVVGDNVARIAEAFRLALSRSDLVIATGGLGPTGDDVTRQGLAEALGVDIRRHGEIEDFLREKFRRLGREMPELNLVQADVPEGARPILPDRGTAPGLVAEVDGGRLVYVVPGVPTEMREMLEGTILPHLARAAGGVTIVSRVLKSVGMAEARVGELLDDLFAASHNPTVAYLASAGEVRVRFTAKASSAEEAERMIRPLEQEVRSRLGVHVFGADDDELEAVVGRMLAERGLSLACAESLTGGELAARITSVAGASKYFAGGVVTYAADAKRSLLGVSSATIEEHGTVSEACVLEMARGARRLFEADVVLATTGVAGPDELEGQPVGTAWVGLAAEGHEGARTFRAPGGREHVRRWAEQAALDLLRRFLLERPA